MRARFQSNERDARRGPTRLRPCERRASSSAQRRCGTRGPARNAEAGEELVRAKVLNVRLQPVEQALGERGLAAAAPAVDGDQRRRARRLDLADSLCQRVEEVRRKELGRRLAGDRAERRSAAVVAVDRDVAVGEVAGPHRRRAAADADVDADLQLLASSCRRSSSPRSSRATTRPSWAAQSGPNFTLMRSRLTGSSARPTAMTMRPQLASSPAKAVLTSGLSAMVRAILRAEAADSAPVTVILTNLVAPSPSRTSCWARSSSTRLQLVAEVGQARDRRPG